MMGIEQGHYAAMEKATSPLRFPGLLLHAGGLQNQDPNGHWCEGFFCADRTSSHFGRD